MATQTQLFSDDAKRANWRDSFFLFEGIFYFFQGFYLTGMHTFLGVSMANFQMPLGIQASISATIGLPTYLKMFFGLLTDRVPFAKFGRRRPYIALGALLYVPAFALLIMMKEFNTLWVVAALSAQVAWVMVDTALDAMTVDVTPSEKTGKIQGAAQSSKMAGMALGMLVVPLIGPRIGWTPTVVIIAIFALIQAGAALLFREIPVKREDLKNEMKLSMVIKQAFRKKTSWLSILFSIFFMGSIGLSSLISPYLLTTLGWSRSEETMAIFGVVNLIHYGAAALGAAIIGPFASKYKDNINFFAIVSIFFWLCILPWFLVKNQADSHFWVYAAQFTYGIARGAMAVLTYSVVMRVCPKSIEGFMFATLTSSMNIGLYALTPNVVAFFVPHMGFASSLFTVVPFTMIGLLVLNIILKDLKGEQAVFVEEK